MTTKRYEYKYTIKEHDEPPEDARAFPSTWDNSEAFHLDCIAEDAAEHECEYYDGWGVESSLTFIIYDLPGEELGRFEVKQDVQPVFRATAAEREKVNKEPAP